MLEFLLKYDPAWFPEKIGGTQTDWGAFPESDDLMPDYRIAEYGVKQLGRAQNKPFLLALGFMRPHVPWYVPQRFFDLYSLDAILLPKVKADDLADVPEHGRKLAQRSQSLVGPDMASLFSIELGYKIAR